MKTTENISLGGLAFTIESDAYAALSRYIEDIKECFSNDSCANEIVEDIEVRISELLKEKCPSGMVINMSMVEDIKKRIGDPKEMAETEEESPADASDAPSSEKQKQSRWNFRERRLYRDIDNRFIGGVCSGLGVYFNLDKVIFRVLFLVFFVLGFIEPDEGIFVFEVIAYMILWIAMPAARTVEEKCEMRRKPMNLEGYKTKENNFEREIREVASSPVGTKAARIFKMIIGTMLLVFGIGGLFTGIFIPSLHEIAETAMVAELSPFDAEEMLAVKIVSSDTFWWMITGSMGIAFIGMIYGGIMLTFDFKNPAWKPGLVLFIAWILSIFIFIAWILAQVAEWLPTIV